MTDKAKSRDAQENGLSEKWVSLDGRTTDLAKEGLLVVFLIDKKSTFSLEIYLKCCFLTISSGTAKRDEKSF